MQVAITAALIHATCLLLMAAVARMACVHLPTTKTTATVRAGRYDCTWSRRGRVPAPVVVSAFETIDMRIVEVEITAAAWTVTAFPTQASRSPFAI